MILAKVTVRRDAENFKKRRAVGSSEQRSRHHLFWLRWWRALSECNLIEIFSRLSIAGSAARLLLAAQAENYRMLPERMRFIQTRRRAAKTYRFITYLIQAEKCRQNKHTHIPYCQRFVEPQIVSSARHYSGIGVDEIFYRMECRMVWED